MATRTVTGPMLRPDGAPWAGMAIGFDAAHTVTTPAGTLPGTVIGAQTSVNTITTTTDSAGDFAVELVTNVTIRVTLIGALVTAGTSTRYPQGAVFDVVVPDGDGPVALNDLIDETNTPVTPTLLGRLAALEELAAGIDGGSPGSAYGGAGIDGGSV